VSEYTRRGYGSMFMGVTHEREYAQTRRGHNILGARSGFAFGH